MLIHQTILDREKAVNVSEAAFSNGFKTVSHFSTSFKEEFGCSPGEFS